MKKPPDYSPIIHPKTKIAQTYKHILSRIQQAKPKSENNKVLPYISPRLINYLLYLCLILSTCGRSEQSSHSKGIISAHTLARLANHAYSTDQKEIENWQVIKEFKKKGYRGILCYNQHDNQAVLAHRGTIPNLSSISTCILSISLNIYDGQAKLLPGILKESLRYTAEKEASLYITGHSLGGWLAQVSMIKIQTELAEDLNEKLVRNIDDIRCVTFDTLGAGNYFHSIKNKYPDINQDNITNYLSTPNALNCCGAHIGRCYRAVFDFPANTTNLNISSHSLSNFLTKLDKPEYPLHHIIQWPQIKIDGSNLDDDATLKEISLSLFSFYGPMGRMIRKTEAYESEKYQEKETPDMTYLGKMKTCSYDTPPHLNRDNNDQLIKSTPTNPSRELLSIGAKIITKYLASIAKESGKETLSQKFNWLSQHANNITHTNSISQLPGLIGTLIHSPRHNNHKASSLPNPIANREMMISRRRYIPMHSGSQLSISQPIISQNHNPPSGIHSMVKGHTEQIISGVANGGATILKSINPVILGLEVASKGLDIVNVAIKGVCSVANKYGDYKIEQQRTKQIEVNSKHEIALDEQRSKALYSLTKLEHGEHRSTITLEHNNQMQYEEQKHHNQIEMLHLEQGFWIERSDKSHRYKLEEINADKDAKKEISTHQNKEAYNLQIKLNKEDTTRSYIPNYLSSHDIKRTPLLNQINNLFTTHTGNSNKIIILRGLVGCGKTHLANDYAFLCKDKPYSMIWWIDASNERSIDKSLIYIYTSLGGINSHDNDSMEFIKNNIRRESSRETKNKKPWLVIWDNYNEKIKKNYQTLKDEIYESSGGHILITTRDFRALRNRKSIYIPPLTQNESLDLLKKYCPSVHEDRYEEYEENLRQISFMSYGYPLAIVELGHMMESPHQLLRIIKNNPFSYQDNIMPVDNYSNKSTFQHTIQNLISRLIPLNDKEEKEAKPSRNKKKPIELLHPLTYYNNTLSDRSMEILVREELKNFLLSNGLMHRVNNTYELHPYLQITLHCQHHILPHSNHLDIACSWLMKRWKYYLDKYNRNNDTRILYLIPHVFSIWSHLISSIEYLNNNHNYESESFYSSDDDDDDDPETTNESLLLDKNRSIACQWLPNICEILSICLEGKELDKSILLFESVSKFIDDQSNIAMTLQSSTSVDDSLIAKIYTLQGTAYNKLKWYPEATSAYTKALKYLKNKDQIIIYDSIGNNHLLYYQTDLAMDTFRKAITLQHKYDKDNTTYQPECLQMVAQCYKNENQIERAIAIYKEVISTTTTDRYLLDAYYYIGKQYVQQSKYKEALKYLLKGKKLSQKLHGEQHLTTTELDELLLNTQIAIIKNTHTKELDKELKSQIKYLLIYTVTNGNLEDTKILLRHLNIPVADILTEDRDTLLHLVARHGHYHMIHLFVDTNNPSSKAPYPIHIYTLNIYDQTPLLTAYSNEHLVLVNLLLEYEASKLTFIGDKKSCTHLYVACYNGHSEVVKYLVENGAKEVINKENSNGCTPFYAACSNGNLEVVKYLVDNGANEVINKENEDGLTPIYVACLNGHLELVKYLVENGANEVINKENTYGCTPLFVACLNGHSEVVKYLVENGANEVINKEYTYGCTPLFVACLNGHSELVKYFTNSGYPFKQAT